MAMMSMMYSVFVAILGYLILSETLNFAQAIGGILIIVSVILIQKSSNLDW
jgi:drug/metabolite transporter (DMT)-like permease